MGIATLMRWTREGVITGEISIVGDVGETLQQRQRGKRRWEQHRGEQVTLGIRCDFGLSNPGRFASRVPGKTTGPI